MRTAQQLVALMPPNPSGDNSIQLRQTKFRMDLVKSWGIAEGSRVLEIGCGQGDTTLVLADEVGDTGYVLAVDIADPNYGAPLTIGESARFLENGEFGNRMDFRFEFDVLDCANTFDELEFDTIVMAHCTWYWESLEKLEETCRRIRPWGSQLCLSEWDLQPQSIDQLGHLLAVLIQGQMEAFKSQSQANVRTPYSRETLLRLLQETGWQVDSQVLVDASELDDARWEIDACLSQTASDLLHLGLPPQLQGLVQSQLEVLRRIANESKCQPLPSYSMVASRSSTQ
ncbi:MAG: methyltransferase domain-containing protein [Fimbriimonadaceae bacterium]|nr:MAG: methyltransferase domain-containing protein [Fimbriimonadaceae bacterium]